MWGAALYISKKKHNFANIKPMDRNQRYKLLLALLIIFSLFILGVLIQRSYQTDVFFEENFLDSNSTVV